MPVRYVFIEGLDLDGVHGSCPLSDFNNNIQSLTTNHALFVMSPLAFQPRYVVELRIRYEKHGALVIVVVQGRDCNEMSKISLRVELESLGKTEAQAEASQNL